MKTEKTNKTEKSTNDVAKDKFGCREGSQASRINATLTDKPLLVEAIEKKTGAPKSAIRSHLRRLMSEGKVKFVEGKGYTEATTKKTANKSAEKKTDKTNPKAAKKTGKGKKGN